MEIFEREEMLIEQGRREGQELGFKQGRKQEKINTERERKRADAAEKENQKLREELRRLQSMHQKM